MSETLPHKVAQFWPPDDWRRWTVVVAVSGGADSVAMLRCLANLKGPAEGDLVVAHFNHQLRGADSDGDQQFVKRLAQKLGLPCVTGQPPASQLAKPATDQAEETARKHRYAFLSQVAAESGARFVVTAHTADDQVETILHRILRGTGLGGLTGIPRTRPLNEFVTLARPLLCCRRSEITEYLEALGQPHREDHSNQERRFTRNRIRHDLLPQLRNHYNSQVDAALLRLQTVAEEAHALLGEQAGSLAAECCRSREPNLIVLDRAPLRRAPEAVVRQMLMDLWKEHDWPQRAMAFERWQELAEVARSELTHIAVDLPGGVVASGGERDLSLRRSCADDLLPQPS